MNREIIFRGKRIDNGEWVYGWLFKDLFSGKLCIQQATFKVFEDTGHGSVLSVSKEVDPETVGQYINLLDANKNKLFEGDIVSGWRQGSNSNRGYVGVIEWQTEQAGWVIKCGKYVMEILSSAMSGDGKYTKLDSFENIGNIRDNPELLNS